MITINKTEMSQITRNAFVKTNSLAAKQSRVNYTIYNLRMARPILMKFGRYQCCGRPTLT